MIEGFETRAVTPEILYWEIEHQHALKRPSPEVIEVSPNERSMGWASLMLDQSDQDERIVEVFPPDFYQKDIERLKQLKASGETDGNSN